MSETQTVTLQEACSAIRTVTPFSATAASGGANVRSAPSVSASIVGNIAANERRTFDAWTYGDTVNDAWAGQPDARWYRLSGTNSWVASGVVNGNPSPVPPPLCSSNGGGNFYRNPDAFFQWANGQFSIARLDRSDLRGECVTLIARYVQEVFLPASDRTQSRAYGHGKDTANVLASNAPFNQYFGPFTNSGLPRRGAVISFPATASNAFGHVAIVLEVRGQQVRILESNRDQRAPNTTVTSDRLVNISAASGWTNPR
ncbi:MAG TPA: CHAP domain-containing protein [Waterburya sp.]|jgi:hypothetical protein